MKLNIKDPHLVGSKLKIHTYPSNILSSVAEPVTTFDNELLQLCHNMLFTMYNAPGIGLAAPQIGKSLRIFVVDVDYKREQVVNADGEEENILSDFSPHVFINPEISPEDEGTITYEEGCLSLPGIYEEVTRPHKITINYQDVYGNSFSQVVEGIASVCIQHENDHLNGTVFIDHLSLLKKNFIRKKLIKQKR